MNTLGNLMIWLVIAAVALGPYVYHLVYCFTVEKYVLLIAGGVIPPIGWLHGLGAFFGWWG